MSKSNPLDDAAVEAAINDVLVSRRDAVDALAEANRDAGRIIDEARDTARRVAERTERRIQATRAAFDAACRARLASIEAEIERQGAGHELMPADVGELARAVEALCVELTGPGSESPR